MAMMFNCPECEKKLLFKYLKAGDEFYCPHCDLRATVPESGKTVSDFSESDVTRRTNSIRPPRKSVVTTTGVATSRFAAVKTLSTVIKVATWIISLACVIWGFVAITNYDLLAGIGQFIMGGLVLIVGLAIAELLLLLLAIETNTRPVKTPKLENEKDDTTKCGNNNDSNPSDDYTCSKCNVELTLDKSDLESGFFVCPNCHREQQTDHK